MLLLFGGADRSPLEASWVVRPQPTRGVQPLIHLLLQTSQAGLILTRRLRGKWCTAERESESWARTMQARRLYEEQVDQCRTAGGACAASVRRGKGRGAGRKCRESDARNPQCSGQHTAERVG